MIECFAFRVQTFCCSLKHSFLWLPPFCCLTCLHPFVYIPENRLCLVIVIFLILCSLYLSILIMKLSNFGPRLQEEEVPDMFLFQLKWNPSNLRQFTDIFIIVKNKSLHRAGILSVPKFSLVLKQEDFFLLSSLSLQRNTLCVARFVVCIKTSLIFLFFHPGTDYIFCSRKKKKNLGEEKVEYPWHKNKV